MYSSNKTCESDMSIFTPHRKDSKGNLKNCIGRNSIVPDTEQKWYGLLLPNKVPAYDFTLCQYCGENFFKPHEVYEVDPNEYPQILQGVTCDCSNGELCKKFGTDRRFTTIGGLHFYVNIVGAYTGSDWVPTMHIPGIEGDNASQNGAHIVPMPSHSYWEWCIKGERYGKYAGQRNIYYRVKNASFEDGRRVSITNEQGNSLIYTPIDMEMRVDSFTSGKNGSRYLFISPTEYDREIGNVSDHHNKSNKLKIKVGIYRKEEVAVHIEYDAPRYRGLNSNYSDNVSKTRGWNGGSTHSAQGSSNYMNARPTQANFVEIDEVDAVIQLVNNESDEEIVHNEQLIQEQINKKNTAKLEMLRKQKISIENEINEIEQVIEQTKNNSRASYLKNKQKPEEFCVEVD